MERSSNIDTSTVEDNEGRIHSLEPHARNMYPSSLLPHFICTDLRPHPRTPCKFRLPTQLNSKSPEANKYARVLSSTVRFFGIYICTHLESYGLRGKRMSLQRYHCMATPVEGKWAQSNPDRKCSEGGKGQLRTAHSLLDEQSTTRGPRAMGEEV